MSVTHHISGELLADYASGALEEGWSLAVATHLALCPDCRRRLVTIEAAAGVMLEDLAEVPAASTDDSSWAALKARLEAAPAMKQASAEKAEPRKAGGIPAPLSDYIGSDYSALKWKALGLGAYQIPIPTGDRTVQARLLRIPAGKPVPEHSHGGRELTLVLKGAFRDGELVFGPGDLEETDDSVQHQPVATQDEDCICLAITDAPLRFKSRMMRLIQPIVGI